MTFFDFDKPKPKITAHNSCFNILADLVELRAIIINPYSQKYSAIKSASILKQRDVSGNAKANYSIKNVMKATILFIFLSLATFEQNDPVKIFENHLKKVEAYFSPDQSGRMIFDVYYLPSIEFLEDLTGNICDKSKLDKTLMEPSKTNLSDWKKWLKENKNKLYWDDDLKKVVIKQHYR
jgi:hypothetical protein